MNKLILLLFIISIFDAKSQCNLDYTKFTEIWSEHFDGTMADVEEDWRV